MDRKLLFGEVGAKVIAPASKKQAEEKKSWKVSFGEKLTGRNYLWGCLKQHFSGAPDQIDPDARTNSTTHF